MKDKYIKLTNVGQPETIERQNILLHPEEVDALISGKSINLLENDRGEIIVTLSLGDAQSTPSSDETKENKAMTYTTVYDPAITQDAKNLILEYVEPSIMSTEGDTNIFLLDRILERDKDYRFLLREDLALLKGLGVDYIEF